MRALGIFPSRIHWMRAQPGDPALLGFFLLVLLALAALLAVWWVSRKRKRVRVNLTKQLSELPIRRFSKKHRRRKN